MNELVKIDGKAISKVGVKLIDAVSAGIGGLYAPVGVVRMAKANAQAKVIAAAADDEASALQSRTLARIVAEEVRRQVNIEQVTAEAIQYLKDDAEPAAVDRDWMANLFDKAKLASDSDMQGLWSRILAGEANEPGSYSRQTVNLLSDFDKSDAAAFSSLCSFQVSLNGTTLLILDPSAAIYNSAGIDFSTLSHLESLGVVKFDSLAGFAVTGLSKHFSFECGGRHIYVALRNSSDSFNVGKVVFTRAGLELSKLVSSTTSEAFANYVSDFLKNQGLAHEPITISVKPGPQGGYSSGSFIIDGGTVGEP
jgi:hypothetical protein